MLSLSTVLEKADKLSDLQAKIDAYNDIAHTQLKHLDEGSIRAIESAVLKLGKIYAERNEAEKIADMLKSLRPFLLQISKAKASKLVRYLVDHFLDLEATTGREVSLCQECIDWAKEQKRTYLRQALEVRLIALYFDTQMYSRALVLGSELLHELKKLDDKVLLVEVQLLESKVYHRLGNLQKSKAALTSSRTTASGIYCPPKLQSALDLQSGILHVSEDRDFETAFSYFYEAFETFDHLNQTNRACTALKYMVLCKIMLNKAEEVYPLLAGKIAQKYSEQLSTMREIATAATKSSLAQFLKVTKAYCSELQGDVVLREQLENFYESLLTKNLLKLIEPCSRVQIDHLANLIQLDHQQVERKLSKMILDKELHGILDQGAGVLVVFDGDNENNHIKTTLDIVHGLTDVVDQLYHRAKMLSV